MNDTPQPAVRRNSMLGLGMALAGALLITPDTLLIRLSGLEGWGLTFWRGLLIGLGLLVMWLLVEGKKAALAQIPALFTGPAIIILIANMLNSVAFNFATLETSITVVLTAIATAPLIAAALAYLILGERTAPRTWIAIGATMIGVLIVIANGDGALQAPDGNVWLGGGLGMIAACGIACVFVMARRNPEAPVLLACGIGTLISSLFGLAGMDASTMFQGNFIAILIMGLFIMPVSWGLLTLAPRQTSPTNVSLFMLLEMVLGPFWVWLGTGERPNLAMMGGTALVLLTLIVYFILSARDLRASKPEI